MKNQTFGEILQLSFIKSLTKMGGGKER